MPIPGGAKMGQILVIPGTIGDEKGLGGTARGPKWRKWAAKGGGNGATGSNGPLPGKFPAQPNHG